jgi:hypothetical protein
MAPLDLDKKSSDEYTPLLGGASTAPSISTGSNSIFVEEDQTNENVIATMNGDTTAEDEDKPLPRLQIFVLCFARMIAPMAFLGILPFHNQMIEDTGALEEANVGFYSGLIVSLFVILGRVFGCEKRERGKDLGIKA